MESHLQGSTSHPDSDGPSECADEVALIPARYWWLKRLSVAGVLLLVAVCVLRIVWGQIADSRLAAEIESYRAAGQLVYAHEFDAALDAVPAERNAAVLYEKAMGRMVSSTAAGVRVDQFVGEPEFFEGNMGAAYELMAANVETLRLVREARDLPEVAWSYRLGRGTIFFGNPQQRALSKLLILAVTFEILTGDHAAAIESFEDFIAFNHAIGTEPTFIASLIAIASRDLNRELIEQSFPRLEVGDQREASSVNRASRCDLAELSQELLDENLVRRDLVRAFHGERATTIKFLTDVADSLTLSDILAADISSVFLIGDYFSHPCAVLVAASDSRNKTRAAEAAYKENYWDASRHYGRKPLHEPGFVFEVVRAISISRLDHGFDINLRMIELFFRTLAHRRMAAISLAIRLYEIDHGRRPVELSVLVPDYLTNLPCDPFAHESATFRYRLNAPRAFLYSVGSDGEDHDGVDMRQAAGSRDRSDIVFYLDPKPGP